MLFRRGLFQMGQFHSQFHNSIEIESGKPNIKARQVVSALERLILTQDPKLSNAEYVDPGKDLIVYGDVVEIRGPLELPGRDVQIFARVLASSADRDNKPAKIDVSGAPCPSQDGAVPAAGKSSAAKAGETGLAIFGSASGSERPGGDGATGARGNPGKPGEPGKAAGNIYLGCTKADPSLRLALVARGGDGQAGQKGQAGQPGQDGGPGAEGTMGFGGIGLQYGTKGGKGGNGGDGGAGGVGGMGGNGGRITTHFVEDVSSGMFTTDVRRGEMGSSGESGAGGDPGEGGKSGNAFEHEMNSVSQSAQWVKKSMENGARGDHKGATPDRTKNPENKGLDGKALRETVKLQQLSERALPAHCTMLMQRVRNGFLAAHDAETYGATAELVAWIEGLTRSWTKLPPATPNRQHFVVIHGQCAALVQRLHLGLTYFGHLRSFAPRASLAFYKGSLEKACDDLESLEKDANGYQSVFEKHTEAASKLNDAHKKAKDEITALISKLGETQKRLPALQRVMESAHKDVLAQENVVTKKLQAVEGKIQEQEGLTLTKLIKVVGGWTVPTETGAKDILKFAAGAIKDIKGIYDEEVATQYKIHRMIELGEGVKLGDAYKVKENQDILDLPDANGFKLLASRKRLDESLKPYYGILEGDEARAALDRLIDLSDVRNQLVLDYNAMCGQIAEIKAEIAQAEQQQAIVADQLSKKARPDLPEFVAWVGDLYDKARSNVIEQVYLASRAYSWWALKDFPIYERLGLKSASTVTAGILRSGQADLLNDFGKVVEARVLAPSPFPSTEARKVNPAARGAVVRLDKDNFRRAFEELRDTGETTLELSPTRPYTTPVPLRRPGESGEMTGFALLAEVMVKKVRAYLRGASSKNGLYAVNIVHCGTNQVVRRDGAEFTFTTVPVPVLFKYEEKEGKTNITFDGNITEETPKGNYAPLSPFGWWRISVDNISHSVDLKGLTAVELEFHGDAYGFSN